MTYPYFVQFVGKHAHLVGRKDNSEPNFDLRRSSDRMLIAFLAIVAALWLAGCSPYPQGVTLACGDEMPHTIYPLQGQKCQGKPGKITGVSGWQLVVEDHSAPTSSPERFKYVPDKTGNHTLTVEPDVEYSVLNVKKLGLF